MKKVKLYLMRDSLSGSNSYELYSKKPTGEQSSRTRGVFAGYLMDLCGWRVSRVLGIKIPKKQAASTIYELTITGKKVK